LYKATKAKEIQKAHVLEQIDPALEKGVITKDEADLVRKTEEARYDAILVDEFTLEDYNRGRASAPVSQGLKKPEKDTVVL
jgi:acyl-CoA dehydrogenase